MCRFQTPASSRRVIHSRLPSGGRTTMGKSSARASTAMSATVSIENGECSMSTRTKSRPAACKSVNTAGVRIMCDPGAELHLAALGARGSRCRSSGASHLHAGELFEDLHHGQAVFLVESGRAGHLVELLGDVGQDERHAQLLGER